MIFLLRVGSLALPLVLAMATACKKDKPAPAPAAGSALPAPSPAPAVAPAAAAAETCDLVGTLELVRPADTPCGHTDRYTRWSVTFTEAKRVGDAFELDAPDGPMANDNVLFTATSTAKPVGGRCALELEIADAGRTDTDEKLTFELQVPVAGGAVTGAFAIDGFDANLKPCTAKAGVTGTFTPGAAKSVAQGPHASLADYCKAVLASVAGSPRCKYGPDEELCSCDAVTKDDVAGPLEAKGTGAIKAATLVRTARSASDYLRCEVAVQLADGWFVHPETFECGPAPAGMGEGQSTELKITKLAIDGTTVELAWTAIQGNYDIDENGNAKPTRSKPEHHALTCTVAADRNVSCKQTK